jgi:[acyl-carrier-protein] S-malonyltransferase
MKYVFLFPGQGSQQVGMGKDFHAAYLEVQETYREAAKVLGQDIGQITFNGPAETLNRTEHTQPAILTLSVALTRLLAKQGISPAACAGHSLGEYAALTAAGVVSFQDALLLVKERGRLMQEACQAQPGGMAAILGSTVETVEEICRQAGAVGTVVIANYNSPDQVVISGATAALERAMALCVERGIKKVIKLAVSGAFHSPLMDSAAAGFASALSSVTPHPPQVPLYFNVTGLPEQDPQAIRGLMQRQINSPVQWIATVRNMAAQQGRPAGVEVGPGKVLQGLVKKIDKEFTVSPLLTSEQLAALTASV